MTAHSVTPHTEDSSPNCVELDVHVLIYPLLLLLKVFEAKVLFFKIGLRDHIQPSD